MATPARLASPRWLPLLVALLFLPTAIPGQDRAVSGKLDRRIQPPEGEEGDPFPIFVRMKDQVFPTTADYLRFCQANRGGKRSTLRTKMIAELRRKSDAAFARYKKLLLQLGVEFEAADSIDEQAGGEEQIEEVEIDAPVVEEFKRYWIVNGFGCRANYLGCLKLAAHPDVERILVNPTPGSIPPAHDASHLVAGRRFGPLYGALRRRRDELVEQFTAMWDQSRAEEAKAFDPKGLEVPWNLRQLGADRVWTEQRVTGAGVVVAVMDTGCLPAQALVSALWRNGKETYDEQDNDGNGLVDDLFGYDFFFKNGVSIGELLPALARGSHTAGIIAGRPHPVSDKQTLVTGVAPRAQIMMLRAMGHLAGYEYALLHGADVMTMGFGFPKRDTGNWRGLYRLAFEHLSAAGMVLVGAAGDSGPGAKRTRSRFSGREAAGKQITMPNDSPCVITVGGVDKNKAVAGASSRGPVSWQGVKGYDDHGAAEPLRKPDVCAWFGGFPCWMFVVTGTEKREGYKIIHHLDDAIGLVRGPRSTALAAAHVAGVAALMLSANRELPAWRIKELLVATAEDLGAKGWDADTGAGLVRALPAVRAAKAAKK